MQKLIADIFSQWFGGPVVLTEQWQQVPPSQRFLVISGKHGLRWIVPAEPTMGWPVLQQWRPYDVISLCKWAILVWAYRFRLPGALPGVRRIGVVNTDSSEPAFGLPDSLRKSVPVIYVGTPGRTRKAVVTLVGVDGAKPLAVAKWPLSSGAVDSILHEAVMLERLACFQAGLAPKLLFVDAQRGVAVQEVVTGRLTDRQLTSQHIDWLCQLRTGATISLAAQSHALVAKLHATSVAAPNQGGWIIALLHELAAAVPLPAVWVHGDFAPWNLKDTVDGLKVVDWEEAQENGPPLLDLLYFFAIQGYQLGYRHDFMSDFFRHPLVHRYMNALELTQQQANMVALLALAGFWVQRLQEGERQHAAFLFAVIKRICGKLA